MDQYQKKRGEIVDRVTRVRTPPNTFPAIPPDPPRKEPSGPLVVARPTAWMVSLTIAGLLIGVVYLVAALITSAHQAAHTKEQLKSLTDRVDEGDRRRAEIETRVVELETQVETLREGRRR